MSREKEKFIADLSKFASSLADYVSTRGGDWSIKGFIDVNRNVYSISGDTKVISKILEIQLFPKFLEFADSIGYDIVLAEHQNWYPDLSFVKRSDQSVKFAVDIKTTYRLTSYKDFCNGFTLGSHGAYFRNRSSTKNIQYPYDEYLAHLCLGILYTRGLTADLDETRISNVENLTSVTSVINDLKFFLAEKWKIASDRSGSGNTANIGSINYIPDIVSGNGAFANLGEEIFDAYWINQGVLQVPDKKKLGQFKKLTKLSEFLEFKRMDSALLNPPKPKRKN